MHQSYPSSYRAAVLYFKGWWLLLMANVLFLMKPPPVEVFLWLNGIALAMIRMGWWLEARHLRMRKPGHVTNEKHHKKEAPAPMPVAGEVRSSGKRPLH